MKLIDKLKAATLNEAASEQAVYASTTKVTQHVRNCGPQMFLISRKGGTLLAINNFLYRSNLKFFGKSNNILYWECVQNRSVKCRSRLKTVGDDLYVTNDVHNHMGDNVRIEAAKVSGMLIHRKLSSLTSADRMQGAWKIEDEATTTPDQ